MGPAVPEPGTRSRRWVGDQERDRDGRGRRRDLRAGGGRGSRHQLGDGLDGSSGSANGSGCPRHSSVCVGGPGCVMPRRSPRLPPPWSAASRVGAGVVLGSAPFNLAALLGLGAVAGRPHHPAPPGHSPRRCGGDGHRSMAALVTVQVRVAPGAGLAISLLVLVRLRGHPRAEPEGSAGCRCSTAGLARWLQAAAVEEEAEIEEGAACPNPAPHSTP